MPEKSRTEYSRVRLHRMGSPLERNDDIFLYQDGHIEVKISSSEGSGFFVFEAEQALTDALLDYLFNSLNFFALNNTYDEEEAAPAVEGVLAALSERIWRRSSLDPIYTIHVDAFNRQNEVAFSYSRCPNKLWDLRIAIDRLLYSAGQVHARGGRLVDLLGSLNLK